MHFTQAKPLNCNVPWISIGHELSAYFSEEAAFETVHLLDFMHTSRESLT
jgi:hypothetical protein